MRKYTIAFIIMIMQIFAEPTEDMFNAIKNSNKYEFFNALKNGAQINSLNVQGETALVYSLKKLDNDFNSLLIICGFNIEQKNSRGDTPLISLIKEEGLSLDVKWLIEEGASIEAKDEEGKTPLILATESNQFDIVKVLVNNGALLDSTNKRGYTATFIALINENYEICQYLLEKGSSKFIPQVITEFNLKRIIEGKYYDVLDYAVYRGASIEIHKENSESSLGIATRLGDLKAMGALINFGAKINGTKGIRPNPMEIAINNNDINAVKFLLDKGASLDIRFQDGEKMLDLVKSSEMKSFLDNYKN